MAIFNGDPTTPHGPSIPKSGDGVVIPNPRINEYASNQPLSD